MRKTHYRKAFDSPYLSSADLVESINLTISHVRLEADKTKKTKDFFNTAYFVEKEIRQGEKLKPMVLNATNSRMMKRITDTAFLEEWNDVPVCVYVDKNVRFGRETMEGLRISPSTAVPKKKEPLPASRFVKALDKIKAGKYTKEALTANFALTPEQLTELQEVA